MTEHAIRVVFEAKSPSHLVLGISPPSPHRPQTHSVIHTWAKEERGSHVGLLFQGWAASWERLSTRAAGPSCRLHLLFSFGWSSKAGKCLRISRCLLCLHISRSSFRTLSPISAHVVIRSFNLSTCLSIVWGLLALCLSVPIILPLYAIQDAGSY